MDDNTPKRRRRTQHQNIGAFRNEDEKALSVYDYDKQEMASNRWQEEPQTSYIDYENDYDFEPQPQPQYINHRYNQSEKPIRGKQEKQKKKLFILIGSVAVLSIAVVFVLLSTNTNSYPKQVREALKVLTKDFYYPDSVEVLDWVYGDPTSIVQDEPKEGTYKQYLQFIAIASYSGGDNYMRAHNDGKPPVLVYLDYTAQSATGERIHDDNYILVFPEGSNRESKVFKPPTASELPAGVPYTSESITALNNLDRSLQGLYKIEIDALESALKVLATFYGTDSKVFQMKGNSN